MHRCGNDLCLATTAAEYCSESCRQTTALRAENDTLRARVEKLERIREAAQEFIDASILMRQIGTPQGNIDHQYANAKRDRLKMRLLAALEEKEENHDA